MSKTSARYTNGELRVRVAEQDVRRAAVRIQRRGASGLSVVGGAVRLLVRQLGGQLERGRPTTMIQLRSTGRVVPRRRTEAEVQLSPPRPNGKRGGNLHPVKSPAYARRK